MAGAKRDAQGRFVKGSVANPKGREKGSKNKVTASVKEMLMAALEGAGNVEYFKTQAKENPQAFMQLVGKLIPAEVKASLEHSGEPLVIVRSFVRGKPEAPHEREDGDG